MPKRLLLVSHCPSINTRSLRDAVLQGAIAAAEDVDVLSLAALQAGADDVMAAQGLILGTTENLGYMSGGLKDFFDRIYYPCLEKTQGLPFAVFIRAGHDGTGTRRAIESISHGLSWRLVQEPVLCRGDYQ